MIGQTMTKLDQPLGIGRRRMLQAGGVLAGTAALMRAATTRAAETLTFDVACDGGTMLISRLNQTGEIGLPRRGDTFIVTGSIYPEGTIDTGLTGPDQAGAIGRWTCRGTFEVDIESGAVPHVASSVLFSFGDGLSATTGQVESAPDALLTDGFEGGVDEIRRIVVGGFGRYAGARGEQIQYTRGENDTVLQIAPDVAELAPNYTFAFTLTD
jgi:hypothetical protein